MKDYDDLWEFDIPIPPKTMEKLLQEKREKENQSTIYKMEAELHKKKDCIEQDIERLNDAKEHYLNIFGWWTPMDRKHYKSIVDKIRYRKKKLEQIEKQLQWFNYCFNADLDPKTGLLV
mgnify:CR=1 FL=1